MQLCVKTTRHIRRFLFVISAVLIAVATGFAAFNAIARFFFHTTFSWSEELCTYCVVLMVYMALPHLEGSGDQLCITAIDLLVKGKIGQRILNYIRGLVTGAAMVILSYHGFDVMLKAFKRNQVTFTLQIPKGYLYGIALLCLVVTIVVWLVLMICNKGEFDDA